jgi:MFS family permease
MSTTAQPRPSEEAAEESDRGGQRPLERGEWRTLAVLGVPTFALALGLPVVVGAWSDRLRTRLGGRVPFVLVATPPLVLSLAILGYAGSIVAAAIIVAAFFAAYDIAYEPYRALYPDLIDDDIAGRAPSTQALFRGAATCLALVGGGLLISIGTPVSLRDCIAERP